MNFSQQTAETEQLYRLILDHALDSFIAIDQYGSIVEWSKQAEKTFGWTREEVRGLTLTDTIIPERYQAEHHAGLRRYLQTGEHRILGRRVELFARCKDGREIPVELTVTPIVQAAPLIFSASLRDISLYKALEQKVQHQSHITKSILDSMADAVVVVDLSGHIILINPAGQQLLRMVSAENAPNQSFRDYRLFLQDGKTLCPDNEKPIARALAGKIVNGWIAFVRHDETSEGVWVSINARPLIDENGMRIGGVAIFHDITALRQREQALLDQGRLLREKASLLEMARDAIVVRNCDDSIIYWNRGAETLYEYSRDEAIGKNCHVLLKTEFPIPMDEIRSIIDEKLHWEGELVQTSKNGRQIVVLSQWAMDTDELNSYRYLETNTDITQRVKTEQALKHTQENYRLVVEKSTEYAVIITDSTGMIVNWNLGAERILGLSYQEVVGQLISSIFTPEDRNFGQPWHELEKAKEMGRAEDVRWHVRRDGTRFWANGVVMPLWNDDGSLRGFVKIMRDQTAARLAEEQTQFLANHDMLTGLPNRVHFSNQLHRSIATSDRNQVPLAVLLLDLDRFKHVNDTFGHHAGDLLLKEVAHRIRSSLRETDFVARLGGDEFVVIQADVSQPQAAETLARKLILELGRPYYLEKNEVISGTSVGITTYPADGNNVIELLKKADLALYRAKGAGRGTYQFYTSELLTEKEWAKDREQRLRSALQNCEFELYYQPQVDLSSWKISTVEALLRWHPNNLDLILPSEFLAIAEETGTIVEIGEWALRNACQQLKAWQNQGMPDLRISVNCSARQFSSPEFVKMIGPILEETGLAPFYLELEINQSMLARQEIKDRLVELRAFGVRITIDNYGTSTAALIDLKEFEVDGLKIDKTFVQHLPHRRTDSAITSSIINLAHNLGIGVSAGGVETAEQLAYLKSIDCNSAQGYIFSPPIPALKFEELMLNGHWSRINRLPSLNDALAIKDLH